MNVDRVTRFETNGPSGEGLVEWDTMDTADLETDAPVQRGYFYFNDETTGFLAGVWDCTPFTAKMAPYPVDEFMHVLEGSVTMELEDGTSTTISAGESFAIPKGLVCKWIQTEYMRKFFVISSNEGGLVHENPAQFGIMCPKITDPTDPITNQDTSLIIGDVPEQQRHSYYTDASGKFSVGIWHSEPFERPVYEFDHHDLMCIVKGVATVSDGADNRHVVKPGDAIFVPKGAQYKWQNDEPVTKIFCAFFP